MVCWSLSNPPGSTPDEYFTIGSIWCANGVDQENCFDIYKTEENSPYTNGLVELDQSSCLFATKTDRQFCGGSEKASYWINSGGYPVGYYKLMNLFIPIGSSLNVLSMRLFNSFIAIGLLAVQLILSNKQRRIFF